MTSLIQVLFQHSLTTESFIIGAISMAMMPFLAMQVFAPGVSLVWSRQASYLAAVPLLGGSALCLAWRNGLASTTSLTGALILGASLLLSVSFTSTVGVPEGGAAAPAGEMPDVASVEKLIKTRRSIFPKDFTGDPVPRDALLRAMGAANWAPTHGKTEPWRFVVLTPERFGALQSVKRAATERLLAEQPEKREAALTKMERKAKELAKVGAGIAILLQAPRSCLCSCTSTARAPPW